MSDTIEARPARAQPVILVTGRNGQVGHDLLRSLQGLGRIVAPERSRLDLADPAQIERFVRQLQPDLIVNAAACTAVEQAESEPDLAYRINAEAPRTLAREARRGNAVLIHYSTDYVFNGEKNAPYVEHDITDPLNVYGRSKLAGECAIAEAGCRHLILRTSWVYSLRGHNFLRTMLRLARERDELHVVADQIGAPTWSATIAAQTAHLISQSVCARDRGEWWDERSGVYHLSASGCASWHDFAAAIVAATGRVVDVKPIAGDAYPTRAQRPANSSLDCSKLWRTFGIRAPEWDAAFQCCIEGAPLHPVAPATV